MCKKAPGGVDAYLVFDQDGAMWGEVRRWSMTVTEATARAGDACRRSEGLGLTFRTNDGPVQALTGVDLTIGKGEFVSFIGPSGCGKTDFPARHRRSREADRRHDLGERHVAGDRRASAAPTAMSSRRPRSFPGARSTAMSAFRAEIMGISAAEQKTRIARVMDLVNLTGFENKYPWQLSGGMQQRASIARALARCRSSADGRAVRRARRDRARPPQQAAAGALGADRQDDLLRHALDPGGGLSLDAHCRHVAASGPGHRCDRIDAAEGAPAPHPRERRNSSLSPTACATACMPGTAMRIEGAAR